MDNCPPEKRIKLNGEPEGIDKLPTEVVHMVFNLLDHKALLNATLVSKKWNAAVSSFDKFLDKTVKIDYDVDKYYEWKLTRKYRKLIVKVKQHIDPCLNWSFSYRIKSACDSLTEIELSGGDNKRRVMIDPRHFVEFTTLCTSLMLKNQLIHSQ